MSPRFAGTVERSQTVGDTIWAGMDEQTARVVWSPTDELGVYRQGDLLRIVSFQHEGHSVFEMPVSSADALCTALRQITEDSAPRDEEVPVEQYQDFARAKVAEVKASGMNFEEAWRRWSTVFVTSDQGGFREAWDSA